MKFTGAFRSLRGLNVVQPAADPGPVTPTYEYSLVSRFIGPNTLTGDQFGCSVDINNSKMVVGARGNDIGTTTNGRAYIYSISSEGLNLDQEIFPATANNQSFGAAIRITEDSSRIFLTAPGYDTPFLNTGGVYVFDEVNGQYQQTTVLTPATTGYTNALGTNESSLAIAASGNLVFAGDIFYDDYSTTNNGRVFVWENVEGTWIERNFIRTTSTPAGSFFGQSIGVNSDGSALVIGAPGTTVGPNSGVGTANYFTRSGNGWVNRGSFDRGVVTNLANSNFGRSISMNAVGNRVAISVPGDITTAGKRGSVFIYDRIPETLYDWELTARIENPELKNDTLYAQSIQLNSDGTTLLVGSSNYDVIDGPLNAGILYVFKLNNSEWSLVNSLPGTVANTYQGTSVALSPNELFIAAGSNTADEGGSNIGSAWLYSS